MRRDPLRPSRRALLPLLLLVGCGAPEALPTAAEEALGTQEAALDCTGMSSSVLIQGASSFEGVLAAGGTWSVIYPANAVALEYFIDGVSRGSPEGFLGENGTRSGSWSFNDGPVSCGSHTFMVKAYPAVYSSTTNSFTWCSPTGVSSASTTVTQSCPAASLSCTASTMSVNCTGSASGGSGGPYTAYWREEINYDNGSTYVGPWFQGSFTDSFGCEKPQYRMPTDRLTISFKARDSSGMESPAVSKFFLCVP